MFLKVVNIFLTNKYFLLKYLKKEFSKESSFFLWVLVFTSLLNYLPLSEERGNKKCSPFLLLRRVQISALRSSCKDRWEVFIFFVDFSFYLSLEFSPLVRGKRLQFGLMSFWGYLIFVHFWILVFYIIN